MESLELWQQIGIFLSLIAIIVSCCALLVHKILNEEYKSEEVYYEDVKKELFNNGNNSID